MVLAARALASLLPAGIAMSNGRSARAAEAAKVPGLAGVPHFAPRAKRIIHLFMAGAPSHLELFDYKPKLFELAGKPLPPEVIRGQRYAFIRSDSAVLEPQFAFQKAGDAGMQISDALPHLRKMADQICFVRSDAYRSIQSCTGPDLLQQRLCAARSAINGFMGWCMV